MAVDPPLRPQPRDAVFTGALGECVLATYAQVGRVQGLAALEATALRTRSHAARELLAYGAGGARRSYPRMLALLDDAQTRPVDLLGVDPAWAAALAAVLGQQELCSRDAARALRLLELLDDWPGGSVVPTERLALYAQLLFAGGRRDRLVDVLGRRGMAAHPWLPYLTADLHNPFHPDGPTAQAPWATAFAAIFASDGLPSPTLAAAGPTPFDRLRCSVPVVTGGSLVSVVVTCFRPGEPLLTSVGSILAQTWPDLEVIVVDDGSGPQFGDVLQRCAALDDRVRVLAQEENRGTYVCRNIGFDAARGEFITVQDDDDWSHPCRIEHQVRPLLADPRVLVTRSRSVRTDENLIFTLPGVAPYRTNASSIMVRSAQVRTEFGYYDEARKSADMEYQPRIADGDRAAAVDLAERLAVVRLRTESLSRADAGAGWRHEGRWAYQWMAAAWLRRRREAGEPRFRGRGAARVFPAPALCTEAPGVRRRVPTYDVVFCADWRVAGDAHRSMVAEIEALRGHGLRIGIAHLESYRRPSAAIPRSLGQPISDLLLDGAVDLIQLDQGVRVGLVLVRDPAVLQFVPSTPTRMYADRVLIVANRVPRDGAGWWYAPATCERSVRDLFAVMPSWTPLSPLVREQLTGCVEPERLEAFDLPPVVDVAAWAGARAGRRRGPRPVIGRAGPDTADAWPAAQWVFKLYPRGRGMDVRMRGQCEELGRLLAPEPIPRTWLMFSPEELTERQFLSQLDFFVSFPRGGAHDAFGRWTLEAIASGCLAVLPQRFEPVFADGALYASPREVRALIRRLWEDPTAYRDQVERGLAIARDRFDVAGYVDRVTSLLAS